MLYFYPNKPLLVPIESSVIDEKSVDPDYWAEIKKNGSRLALRKEKDEALKYKSYQGYVFYNGHKKRPLAYEPSPELIEELSYIKIPEGTHIDAELLHQKTKKIKHLIYVYDIYWYKGKQVHEALEIRRRMIEDIFKDHYKHFVLSKIYCTDFRKLFYKVITEEENEGLVLKSKEGTIVWDANSSPDVWWQIKVRKPNNNYHF
ncbi:hypothetical protein M0R19_09225 [Candidatus Pacearchaeota archaeon]|nr:hypothetical protein [Candidatus Pacearchaeota archaeon]